MAKNATIHSKPGKAAGPLIVLLILLSSSVLVSGQDPNALAIAKEDNLVLEDISPLDATAGGMLRGSGTGDAWHRELSGCTNNNDCEEGYKCCTDYAPMYNFCTYDLLLPVGECFRARAEGEFCRDTEHCEGYALRCDQNKCSRPCSKDADCVLGDYSWCDGGWCTLGKKGNSCRTHDDCKAHSCHLPGPNCRPPKSYESIYQFYSFYDWRCMDMSSGSSKNVHINDDCHYGDQQLFNYDSSTNTIKDKRFGYCLDVKPTGSDKFNVYGYPCHNGGNQRWYMDKKRRMRSYRYEHKCLDKSSSGNLYMGNCHDWDNQKFSVPSNFADNFFRDHYGYGVIKIKSHSGECIDENYNDCRDGSKCAVHSYDCHYNNNQLWTWEPENPDNQYWGSIKNRNSGNCLRIWSSKAEVWPCAGSDRDKWRIDNKKRLRNKHDSGKCLKRKDNGSGFDLSSCGDNNEKKFIMESDFGMGRVV